MTEIKQLEDDAVALGKIFRHINKFLLTSYLLEGLAKREQALRIPVGLKVPRLLGLKVYSAARFLLHATFLAKSYKLQEYEHRIYFKKYLTSSGGQSKRNYLQRDTSYNKVVNTKGNSLALENWSYSTMA